MLLAARVLLTWEAPNNNGGLHIDGYFIMMKEGNSEWHELARVPNNRKSFKVRNLKPETAYQFRVGAENAVGRGLCLELESTVFLDRRPGA